MLEVKNLVKHYSTKGGVLVKALDDISVQFPETGMVFLLGRSGSGKSTLLNVAGGLDQPDSGEIIVKGRSSKDFTQADFDSYRNTYVGFVFQEYNILNEFTVEQNIALALQLQSKPNDKKAVNELLKQVDLEGLGRRKPNTLSGGQKQRVAIARALIKNPEIIFADEPTGALDSNTGRQVLDTLKKLSETKLVVVVSHDREFAEFYGDRIIELKDGKVISDVSKGVASPEQLSQNVQIVSDDTISIRNTENVTEADVKRILTILKKNKSEAIITAGKRELPEVKRACRISEDGNRKFFTQTKQVDIKEYDGSKTKFIKSRLPISHAVKMGASGLKTKPIRLIFTILLSVISFVLFGVVSTFMLYDSNYSVSEALKQANYPSITVGKDYIVTSQQYQVDNITGDEKLDYEYDITYKTRFGEQELKDKNASANGVYAGIFNFTSGTSDISSTDINTLLYVGTNPISPNVKTKLTDYYPVKTVFGFTDCGEAYMRNNGFTFIGTGRYPTAVNEIAIPEYIANMYVDTEGSGLTTASDLVGRELKFVDSVIPSKDKFTIVGVYKVGEIPSKYDELKDSTSSQLSVTEKETLKSSLRDYLEGSFNTIIFVSDGFYDTYKDKIVITQSVSYINSFYTRGLTFNREEINGDFEEWWGDNVYIERTVKDYSNYVKLYDLDGNVLDNETFTISDNQVYIAKSIVDDELRDKLRESLQKLTALSRYDKEAKEYFSANATSIALNLFTMTDFTEIIETVNYWSKILKEKEYLFNVYDRIDSFADIPQDVKDAGDKILSCVRGGMLGGILGGNFGGSLDNINTVDDLTDTDWQVLRTWVNNNLKTLYPQVYYYDYALEMYNNLGEKVFELDNLFPEGIGLFDVIEYGMRNNTASDQNFQIVKGLLLNGTYRETMGHDIIEDDQRFLPDLKIDIDKIYYKNYQQLSGSLQVVGYFEIEGYSHGASYLVANSFRIQYSELYDAEEEYTWKYVEITDYVEPEDVKYNYIIRLTDNSQEQIAQALESDPAVSLYLTNQIYNEMQFFVELISSLQKIFLVAGIVLGIFAGLMLLNFISVSITAKRKDIGILRAVGARGSDVFKIFFAEAFIIAFICFILASVGAYFVCDILNNSMGAVVNMKLLHFQPVNVLMILLVSFGISIVATYFPVKLAANKSPVESIRAL